jgi:hypothetical protein
MAAINEHPLSVKPGIPVEDITSDQIPEGVRLNDLPSAANRVRVSYLFQNPGLFQSLLKYSRFLKVLSIIDSLVCALFYFGGLTILIFLIVFPLTGFCAAKYYHKTLLTAYGGYLFLIIVARALFIALMSTTLILIIQTPIIVYEVFVAIIVLKFNRKLCLLTKAERVSLRMVGYSFIIPAVEVAQQEINTP